MNTSKELLTMIFSSIKRKRLLQSDAKYEFIEPLNAEHGDVAATTNLVAVRASGQATNHDHKHVPVSVQVCCSDASDSRRTAQLLRFGYKTEAPTRKEELEHPRTRHLTPAHYGDKCDDVDAPAAECVHAGRCTSPPPAFRDQSTTLTDPSDATEHAGRWTLLAGRWTCTLDAGHSQSQTSTYAHPACRDQTTTLTDPSDATEHDMPPCAATEDDLHRYSSNVDDAVATPTVECECTDDEVASVHAGGDAHPQDANDSADLHGEEAEKLYCSIGLLLWNANLDSQEVENIIRNAVQNRLTNGRHVLQSMETICYPFFFAERAGHQNWKPKDPLQTMQNLLWYDFFRQQVLLRHRLPAKSILTKEQTHECWKDCLNWFQEYEIRPDQKRSNTSSYMSARMHNDVGSRFAIYAAWTFGTPTISQPLRQTCLKAAMLQSALSLEDHSALQRHVAMCVEWFEWMADDIQCRKATDRYQEEKRKSGRRNQSGLNAAELAARQHKKQQKRFPFQPTR